MDVLVVRYKFNEKYTEGRLYINGKYICDTLEDCNRELYDSMPEEEIIKNKVYGETCIPFGSYKLVIDYSNKFQKELVHILNVKGFSGVRIHSLNTAEESIGCIGVGVKLNDGYITKSRATYAIIHKMVSDAIAEGEDIFMTIKK